jgi:hypothetical protein
MGNYCICKATKILNLIIAPIYTFSFICIQASLTAGLAGCRTFIKVQYWIILYRQHT